MWSGDSGHGNSVREVCRAFPGIKSRSGGCPQGESRVEGCAFKPSWGFATDPVAGLSVAYESLGAARALSVGISFGVVFTVCVLFGTYRLIPGGIRPPGVGGFFKLLVCAFVPFVSLAGASALGRLVFRGKGGLSNDSFIAGASLLPFGLVMLLSSILYHFSQ